MKRNRTIKTKRLTLRPRTRELIKYWLKYPREKEINKMYGGNYKTLREKDKAQGKEWYSNLCKSDYAWSLNLKGEAFGIAKLNKYDKIEKSIFYSIGFFSSKFYRKGYGTEITKAIIDFVFNYLKLEKIKLHVLEYNKRAIRCYRKAGFKRVKIIENSLELYGKSYNDIEMVIKKT